MPNLPSNRIYRIVTLTSTEAEALGKSIERDPEYLCKVGVIGNTVFITGLRWFLETGHIEFHCMVAKVKHARLDNQIVVWK